MKLCMSRQRHEAWALSNHAYAACAYQYSVFAGLIFSPRQAAVSTVTCRVPLSLYPSFFLSLYVCVCTVNHDCHVTSLYSRWQAASIKMASLCIKNENWFCKLNTPRAETSSSCSCTRSYAALGDVKDKLEELNFPSDKSLHLPNNHLFAEAEAEAERSLLF